ncbi:hypothetical protein BC830DRAFT_650496 [Chytriomyces sp. MP71]|nr:hypothetical protein BC830DRAFT_650496 [Chytriomyces sp. MP71]
MDDMDDGLFANTGLVKKKIPAAGNHAGNAHILKSSSKDHVNAATIGDEVQTNASSPWSHAVSLSEGNSEKSKPGKSNRNVPLEKRDDLWSVTSNNHSDDDLFESMGLGGKSASKSPQIGHNSHGFSATQSSFDRPARSSSQSKAFHTSTSIPVTDGGSLLKNESVNDILFASKSPNTAFTSGFSDTTPTTRREHATAISISDTRHRSESPASIVTTKSKEDDFVPSFLMEASSGRRRRGGPAATGILGNNLETEQGTSGATYKDPFASNSYKDPFASMPIKESQSSFSVSPNIGNTHAEFPVLGQTLARNNEAVKKNPLISSVTAQLSRASPKQMNDSFGFDSLSFSAPARAETGSGFLESKPKMSDNGLSFLDPKPRISPVPQFSENLATPVSSRDKQTLDASKRSQHLEIPKSEGKSSLSKSSSLSSIVSLGPTDDENEIHEAPVTAVKTNISTGPHAPCAQSDSLCIARRSSRKRRCSKYQ